MKKIFNFYGDPGHGWLAVPRKLLLELGIAAQISCYSYQHNETVYLEEDCDYPVFLDAIKDAGVTPVIREHHADRRSKIRSYDSYLFCNCEVTNNLQVIATVHDPRTNEGMLGAAKLFYAPNRTVADRLAKKWAGNGLWASVYSGETKELIHEIPPNGGDHA